jgi:hypothetical protein
LRAAPRKRQGEVSQSERVQDGVLATSTALVATRAILAMGDGSTDSIDLQVVITRRAIEASSICNLDEVGLAFEEVSSRTLASKGVKTVSRLIIKSGWDKRQMTCRFSLFADSLARIKPLIIYHGTEAAPVIKKNEGYLYADGVVVKYNLTAWNNEKLMLEWIEEQWKPAINSK